MDLSAVNEGARQTPA